MAQGIIVNLGGEVSEFSLTRVDREKLYGKKMKVVVDEAGAPAVSALLTGDGSALIPPGGTASLHVDDTYNCVERSALQAVDKDGKPLAPVPSTLGVEQPLTEVSPRTVLDHVVTALYQLDPTKLGDALRAALDAGRVFQTRFNYRDDFDDSPAFLLKNEAGTFALVAQPTPFPFIQRDAPPPLPDAEDAEDADDLDFGMM